MNTQIYVYILQSVDGRYYTGCCDELAIVLAKYDKYNKLLLDNDISLPAKLLHQQKFKMEEETKKIANEIKKWSKKEKQFFINNDWPEISKLTKKFIY
jgi:predicted GIY-YIG superfamily endonuclease